ncbi:MAG: bifunctional riboflavin kinase/FAD synthetase [Lachnospiraceae bacterium]|nr:bifunctional riboflavin kinase/FAD synthetase [Lachnospiraceae bacterium]
MKIISNTTDFQLEQGTAVAIGKFDGVHIGHRRLLEEILARKEKGLLACVFTFDPPPEVLFGISDGKSLSSLSEKRSLFEKMGVDVLVEFPMNRETAGMAPERFVTEVLLGKLHMQFIAAGWDLSFGSRGAGNVALLERMAEEHDFAVKVIDKVFLKGIEVSSSYIRSLVKEGNMEAVQECLGTPFFFKGEVVHGNHIGTGIGFPTVNLLPAEDKLLPPNGVYYSGTIVDGREYPSITNIGRKPTVGDKERMGVETYIYDFDRDIYGKEIEVRLLGFRRPERKFAGLEQLQAQLREDVEAGKEYAGRKKQKNWV